MTHDRGTSSDASARGTPPPWLRLALVAALIAGFIAFFAFDLDAYVSFDSLKRNREALRAFVGDNSLWAPLLFGALYAVVIAFSLPGGAFLTITGGFLFGWLAGGLIVVVGATIGATALFLIARTAVGGFLEARAGPFVRRMEEGFRKNAWSYMLVLRLIPLFPFWLVNLVPALLGVPTVTYVVTTFVGIIPGTFVYASVGNGLGALLDAGKKPDLEIIFEPEIFGPLVGLAVLALLPVIYKKIKRRDKPATLA